MKLSKDDIKLFEEYEHLAETSYDFELYEVDYLSITCYVLIFNIKNNREFHINDMLFISKTKYLYMKRKIIINKLNK